jgi:threonine synthase
MTHYAQAARPQGAVRDGVPSGWGLRCHGCGREPEDAFPDYCSRCGFPVELLDKRFDRSYASTAEARATHRGMARFETHLPLRTSHSRLSVGEGDTPLVTLPGTGAAVGLPGLLAKLDSLNPSGSFKDRAAFVGVARAVETDSTTVVCASSGNAAGSVAMYAARAGLRAVITVPEGVSPGKVSVCRAHGAIVLSVRGDYSASFQLARELSQANRWPNLSTTFVNPFCVAGLSTVAYELCDQSPEPIGCVVVPVGAGPLLQGVYAGYRLLEDAGLVPGVPRLVAAQSAQCAPIVRAFESGEDEVEAWSGPVGSVSGLNDALRGYPRDGTVTLRAVRATGGFAVGVEDEEIRSAAAEMATKDGVFVEPAAAVPVAAAAKLVSTGVLDARSRVVCLATGHGLKSRVEGADDPTVSVDDLANAQRALQRLDAVP